MRVVGVHDRHQVGSTGQGALEAGEIRRAESALSLAVQHLDRRQLGREAVGQVGRSVAGAIVDHEDPVGARRHELEALGCRSHHALDVAGLVVGGDREPDALGHDWQPYATALRWHQSFATGRVLAARRRG